MSEIRVNATEDRDRNASNAEMMFPHLSPRFDPRPMPTSVMPAPFDFDADEIHGVSYGRRGLSDLDTNGLDKRKLQ